MPDGQGQISNIDINSIPEDVEGGIFCGASQRYTAMLPAA